MNIVDVISVMNQMQSEGVIEKYAIGGAVGATFFLEPLSTIDVDVFVSFQANADSILINPQPVFDYLVSHGGTLEGEYVMISGWPVQILPPTGPLVEEAIETSLLMPVGNITASVFTADHLAAIALQVGRGKDKARLLQFIEAGVLDPVRFESILSRHQLLKAWNTFREQFLPENS